MWADARIFGGSGARAEAKGFGVPVFGACDDREICTESSGAGDELSVVVASELDRSPAEDSVSDASSRRGERREIAFGEGIAIHQLTLKGFGASISPGSAQT